MTQARIADLFEVKRHRDSSIFAKFYWRGEVRASRATFPNGNSSPRRARAVRRHMSTYSLDAIASRTIAVNSQRSTAFRRWATGVLSRTLMNAIVSVNWSKPAGRHQGGSSRTSRTRRKPRAFGCCRTMTRIPGACSKSTTKIVYQIDRPRRPPRSEAADAETSHAAIVSLKNDQVKSGGAGALFGIERDQVVRRHLGQHRTNVRWAGSLSKCRGAGSRIALFHHQRPPLLRRQQAPRQPAVLALSGQERLSGAARMAHGASTTTRWSRSRC